MGAQLDDANREAVGLAPIWTGAEAEAESAPDPGSDDKSDDKPAPSAPSEGPAVEAG